VLTAVGVFGLVFVSWPPIDWALSRPLEAWYPVRPFQGSPGLEAIAVLSESIQPPHFERPYPLADSGTYERCEFAAWIYKRFGPLPILASGGPGASGAEPFSITMRNILESAGVPAAMIWTEEQSQSTHENALYGAKVLRSHGIRRIALVVDARSMFRAAASFRKQGIEVTPAPCAFREFGPLSSELLPNWKAIRQNEETLHEVGGLAWYWVRGWI
jgi:uncharacterized SAM-binding protein YcdF (DUF218 family)